MITKRLAFAVYRGYLGLAEIGLEFRKLRVSVLSYRGLCPAAGPAERFVP
jgi:hypothetical protein